MTDSHGKDGPSGICAAYNAGACATADALGRKPGCECCQQHDERGRVQTPETRPSEPVGIQRNAARCHSCGEEIESTHRHDFRSCSCGNLSVDGGRAYIKRGYRTGSTWDELTVCHHRPNPYLPERCEFCGHPTDGNGPSDKTTPARGQS